MKIHPIQTGSVQVKTRQLIGVGKGFARQINMLTDPTWSEALPIYAWLIEHDEGLILVDSGETARASQTGYFPGWHPFFRSGARMDITEEQEIGPQLKRLGFSSHDVKTIVITHLHTDHTGGLHHFPKSNVIVHPTEYRTATGPVGRLLGYLPYHWPAWLRPQIATFPDGPIGPFAASQNLTRAGDVCVVPTLGHTPGHIAVLARKNGLSYLFAGDMTYLDTSLLRQQVDGISLRAAVTIKTMQTVLGYAKNNPTVYLPTHDPFSARRLEAKAPLAA